MSAPVPLRTTRRARVVAALSCVAAATAAVLAAPVVSPASAAPAAPAAAIRSSLAQGQTLAANASLVDDASGQRLTMQGDGNLVLTYLPAARVLWSSRTGVAGSRLVFRSGGDLQVVSPSQAVQWHSGTSAASGLTLTFDPCGRMAIAPQWTSSACAAGTGALVGARVSPDGRSRAVQQTDGNFVVYTTAGGRGSRVLWATRTSGAVTAVLQRDQNFALYRGSTAVWSSGTGRSGCGACRLPSLAMQSDGNLVLTSTATKPAGVPVWSSRTTAASWADADLLMTSSSLGPVKVGMTVAQAEAAAVIPLDDQAPGCQIVVSTDTAAHRSFTYENGRVTAVLSGNSSPFYDHTAAGITATSTGDDVLRAYGSAARSYTDIYDTFNVLVRTADGNELRFEMFNGRSGTVSLVQGGVPSQVERTEICG